MDDKQLTSKELLWTIVLPCGLLPCKSELIGNDDVLLILGLNNFEKENEPNREGFSPFSAEYASGAWVSYLSTSEAEGWNLKLSPERSFFMKVLPLDDVEHGDACIFADAGLHIGRIFILLESEPGVKGTFAFR